MGPCPKSGEMQVQAKSDTSNCYNSFIKGYYFLLHLFETLMDEYTYNSQLSYSCFLSVVRLVHGARWLFADY